MKELLPIRLSAYPLSCVASVRPARPGRVKGRVYCCSVPGRRRPRGALQAPAVVVAVL